MDTVELANSTVLPWVSHLPPEVWTMVGQVIQAQKTLRSLVQVCQGFRDIFAPFLYSRRVLLLHELAPTTQLDQKALPPGLTYAKEFEIFIFEFCKSARYDVANNGVYAAFLTKILKQMANLRSFKWLDITFDNFYHPPLILRNSELLKTLKNCKTLKNISIQFASQYLEDIVAAGNCFISLKGFKNLESLELYNFYGDEKRLTRDIDGVLSNCPSLKTLGLGKACDCDCKNLPEAIILVSECKFLENICIEFASRSKVPLALNTLRLGHGLCLFGSSSPAVGNVLEKMVKIAGLRKLHVFNGFIKYNMDEDRQRMEIDWSLLKDCTSLHQLSVSRLEDDVRKWLNGGGNSVEELIVTDHYSLYDEEMDEWDALNLPNLSMLFTREITVPKRTAEDDWLDTDSSGTESSDTEMSDNELPDIDSLDLDSLDVKLSDIDSWGSDALNSDESSCLQGRSRSAMTVLDRLHDHGSHLEKLGLCLDFERQWAQFSLHLSNMPFLTQLRLDRKSYRPGRYPTIASSLWPGVDKPKDIAVHYAKLIKSICPSLQCIRIDRWAWQFAMPRRIASAMKNPTDILVDLRELEQDEVLAIELFALDNWTHQCGLVGPEEPEEDTSEEEQMRVDEEMERHEEILRRGRPAEEYYA